MDHASRIKWTLLATLGWSVGACGETLTEPNGGASGGSDHGSAGPASCTNPTPITHSDKPTGFVQCDEGYRHRVTVETCENNIDKDELIHPNLINPDDGIDCAHNSDCEGEMAHCISQQWPPSFVAFCQTGCLSDSDCEDGFVCDCGSPIGACREATCTTDADCDTGQLCVMEDYYNCGAQPKLGCTKDADACRSNEECAVGESCRLGDEARSCKQNPTCGRPFLIFGKHREANPMLGSRFSDRELNLPHHELSAAQREQIYSYYLKAAQMEHASIAAFARFALQLLQLGAPAELVQQAGEAQLDETRHAEICFALASHYGQTTVGPGPLDVSGALSPMSLMQIVELCVLEGCIGESMAALEVSEAAAAASDPNLSALLQRIAEDELRHAALSYRFVRWAIEKDPNVRQWVKEIYAQVMSAQPAQSTSGMQDDALVKTHGVLSPAACAHIRKRAHEQVVAPCMQMLLADSRPKVELYASHYA